MAYAIGVPFPSKKKREDVTDAVVGSAAARKGETDEQFREVELLFVLSQPLLYIDEAEPGIATDSPILDVAILFEDEDEYQECYEFLQAQTDEDLQWFGNELESGTEIGSAENTTYFVPPTDPYNSWLSDEASEE